MRTLTNLLAALLCVLCGQTATVVVIQPAVVAGGGTETLSIATGTDDAHQIAGGVNTGTTSIGSSMDETTRWIGLRFQNVAIPQGSTIVSAHCRVMPTSASQDEPDVTVYAEASDSAATFNTDANSISSRSMTSSTTWSVADLGADGLTYFNTSDLTTQVQAVIDRAGWSSGNAIAILMSGSATSTRDLTIFAYENTTGSAQLVIEWTP